MEAKIKVVFMGSGNFGLEVLKKVVKALNIELLAVITQPDKPFGRKKELKSTVVADYCYANLPNSPLFKAANSAEILDIFSSSAFLVGNTDYICVADYGVLLSEQVLKLPKKLCLNVHGSILPKYRGASPVHAAILNNDQVTGVSIITMEKGLDTGPIWAINEIKLNHTEFYFDLLLKLGEMGGALFVESLIDIDQAVLNPIIQDNALASYAGKISKEAGFFDLNTISSDLLFAMYRAYKDWPSIFTTINSRKFIFTEIEFFYYNDIEKLGIYDLDIFANFKERKFTFVGKDLWFKINNRFFKVVKFKPESKAVMDPYAYFLGNPDFLNE